MNKEEGKILGIIGGMGPLATNIFYQMIIDLTPAHIDQDHLNMIILSHATMPDRTKAIQSGNLMVLKNKLIEDAKFLESSGAACIAVPCLLKWKPLPRRRRRVNYWAGSQYSPGC